MAFPVKFLSLQKPELEYEVSIRGSTPGLTVQELRKQISKLGLSFPSEDILESSLSVSVDLKGVNDVLAKIQNNLESQLDRNLLLRTQNLLSHLYHRLNRIVCDETSRPLYDACIKDFQSLSARFNTVKATAVDAVLANPAPEPLANAVPVNVNVTCDRGSSNELCKIKFDGKTCVRAFIQRVTEFCEARSIPDTKVLSYATEIFVGDALHWYRSVKGQVSGWVELTSLLKQDFSQSDFDYRLLSEIRSRSQGESENISIYLSIMSGLFSRLSKTLSEEDKIEIILHNIRPCYASILASVPSITDIDTLRTLCRNYENIQARLADFREPPRRSSDTLAPEFAYVGSNSNRNNSFKNYNYKNNNNNKFNHTNNNNTIYNNKPHYTNNNNNHCNKSFNNTKQIHAIEAPPVKSLYCPRCRCNSHNLRQCKANKDNIYCFVCGEKGVKTPQCPKCKDRPTTSKN